MALCINVMREREEEEEEKEKREKGKEVAVFVNQFKREFALRKRRFFCVSLSVNV